jgi:hypothetical protein
MRRRRASKSSINDDAGSSPSRSVEEQEFFEPVTDHQAANSASRVRGSGYARSGAIAAALSRSMIGHELHEIRDLKIWIVERSRIDGILNSSVRVRLVQLFQIVVINADGEEVRVNEPSCVSCLPGGFDAPLRRWSASGCSGPVACAVTL